MYILTQFQKQIYFFALRLRSNQVKLETALTHKLLEENDQKVLIIMTVN